MRDIVVSFIVGVSLGTFGGCLVLLLLPEGRMAIALYLASIILWGLLGACAGGILALGKMFFRHTELVWRWVRQRSRSEEEE